MCGQKQEIGPTGRCADADGVCGVFLPSDQPVEIGARLCEDKSVAQKAKGLEAIFRKKRKAYGTKKKIITHCITG